MDVGRRAPLASVLMTLRGAPEAVGRRIRRLPRAEGRELVVGGVGRFWTPQITWREVPAQEFAGFAEPGWAAIAWGFHITPTGDGRTLIVTECRTRATDAPSRRAFLRYWRLVGPFAAYIIGLSPRLVGERAERG